MSARKTNPPAGGLTQAQANFKDVWRKIRQRVSKGDDIRNWSYDNGYTGNVSHVEQVNYDEVVFSGERTNKPRHVLRTDFETVFEHWEQYKQGLVSRDVITKISRNSTYILSLFHWLENEEGK
jgi:hypothetical protein